MDARQLFQDYSRWRIRTNYYQQQPFKRRIKLTDARLTALQRMIEWCNERQLDPRRWLYTLFRQRRWLHAPRFEQLTPKDPRKALQVYHKGETPLYSEQIRQERHTQQEERGARFDPNRDLSMSVEGRKRHYNATGQSQRCMEEMSELLGYHPRSSVCARCPIAGECARRLQAQVPFDIFALRRGELTAEQCRQQAERAHGRN